MCKEGDTTVCPKIGIIFGAILIIVGAILAGVGSSNLAAANELVPLEDFSGLGDICNITSVDYLAEDRQRQADGGSRTSSTPLDECYDLYTYHFEVVLPGQSTITTTTSKRFELVRNADGKCADEKPRKATPFPSTLPQTVTCWKSVVTDVPKQYECGNTICVKLVDPSTEVANAASSAKTLMLVGIFIGAGGILLAGAFAIMLAKVKRNG